VGSLFLSTPPVMIDSESAVCIYDKDRGQQHRIRYGKTDHGNNIMGNGLMEKLCGSWTMQLMGEVAITAIRELKQPGNYCCGNWQVHVQ
jgi:hypothetical protein